MDFLDRLVDEVNRIDRLPIRCEPGYLGEAESFVVYPIPGSRVVDEYFSGMKDQQLNYEFAMQSRVQKNVHDTLWIVQNALEKIENISSNDESFEFDEIIIANKPYLNNANTQGWSEFRLNIQAKITTFNKESVKNG